MTIFKREIKTFVRRQRKIPLRLQKAMKAMWPCYGLDIISNEKLNLDLIFGRQNKKILEIGFGQGDTLLPMAIENIDCDYLGIEVHEPGIAVVMLSIQENNLKNIRVIKNDAVKILQENISNNTFSHIHIYFPDPWPKLKHHKRRIIQAEFVELLREKLCIDGIIHCATDWENYAEQMMKILSANKHLKNCSGENQFADNKKLQLRANTKFEKRGVKLGHGVWDLVFQNAYPNDTTSGTETPGLFGNKLPLE